MKLLLQRYLASAFIPPFVLSALFFVGFLLTFQLFRLIRLVLGKDVPMQTVLDLLGHISVSFLPLSIPLSLLFATLYVFNKLSEDSEILAIRSMGFTRLKMISPLLILGLMIGLTTFSIGANMIPRSKREFKNIITKLTSKGFLAEIKEGNFFTQIPGITIFTEEVKEEGRLLEKVFINIKKEGEESERIIFAKRGILAKEQDFEKDETSLSLTLFDGNILRWGEGGIKVTKTLFEKYDFPIHQGELSASFVTKHSMLPMKDLYKYIQNGPEQLKRKKITKKDLFKSKIEFWSRINASLLCPLFIILGFCLGITNARGKRRNTSLIGLITLVLYYSIFFTGISFAKSGAYPPFMAVIFPSVLLAIACSYLYRKLEWIS